MPNMQVSDGCGPASFSDFRLELLIQFYRPLNETTYRYESAGGEFVTGLSVNAEGP
jgi:hypothetical protein